MINGIKIVNADSKLYSYKNVQALETSLVQSCSNYKELILEFEEILTELECTKSQILIQKAKCENQTCASSEALRKVIDVKDSIIQSIANILVELNDTKNLNVISDAFQIISGEKSPLTPPKSDEPFIKLEPTSKLKDLYELNLEDVTLSAEINSQSGRKSPIIPSKKLRNPSGTSTDIIKVQDKKKCPETWSTPERKTVKLTSPTHPNCKSNGKFRQGRLNFFKVKTTRVVDLTNYSEPTGDVVCDSNLENMKESMENDDTILPSPTSGPINFTSAYKSIPKSSPRKVKKSLSVLKLKTDSVSRNKENNSIDKEIHITSRQNILKESNGCESSPNKKPVPVSKQDTERTTFFLNNYENMSQEKEIEDPVDLLRHFPGRYPSSPVKQSPSPKKCNEISRECCNESMSILHQLNRVVDEGCHPCSPRKRASLHKDIQPSPPELEANATTNARTKPDVMEPIFKEPTVRKKLDKQALPGWSCEECKQFYEMLYKDDPAVQRQKVCACSRHRARSDPARPRTPPGFWQPRWDVPTDTEEFNRLNDAL